MSNTTSKIAVTIAIVAIVFSAFNTFLMLNKPQIEDELNAQQEQIKELQDTIQQITAQNQQLNQLQTSLDEQEERIDELQDTIDQLSLPAPQINQLQNDLNQTRQNIQQLQSNISTLNNQINSLNQSTNTSLTEINVTVESLEEIISDISDLEEIINQLNQFDYLTPAEIYQYTYRSVVVIRTPLGQGSGFLYNNSEIIITNYHVVEQETNIEIEFFDRTRTQATVIGSDAYSDIAVLSVTNTPAEAEPLAFGNQSKIGQEVMAIGNPLGLTDSLSVGHISQVNRLLDIEPIIVPTLQLDLTIAPGSSGGPLLDMTGKVVGITNAGTDVGFNFAVPVNIMTRVVSSILETGEYKHPFVGFSIVALTPEVISSSNILNLDPYQNGLLVVEVVPDLPADQAGLDPAISGIQGITAVDIVLAVDDNPTFTIEDWTAYMEVEVSSGQTVTLTVWRSGETESVDVTTTERPPYTG